MRFIKKFFKVITIFVLVHPYRWTEEFRERKRDFNK
jgi:hypothetical protein